MSNLRLTRVNELLRREIAASIYRVVNHADFDLAAITISHVVVSSDLRKARVLVSIRDHEEDREKMLRVLKRHAHEFQQNLSKHVTLKYIPRLQFVLDGSIERGDRVIQLLSEIEEDHEEEDTDWDDESAGTTEEL